MLPNTSTLESSNDDEIGFSDFPNLEDNLPVEDPGSREPDEEGNPVPEEAVSVPGETIPVPGEAVPDPGKAAPVQGEAVPVPGESIPVPERQLKGGRQRPKISDSTRCNANELDILCEYVVKRR